ncbi:MAG: hypothetical protein NT082_04835 [Chloroflexi bacterium]|nr:hypothetical protein [Chloroflexota bacterium]
MKLWNIGLILLILGTGSSLSCVNKEYTYQETYYVTENRTQYYTENYTEIEKIPAQSGEDIIESYDWYNQGTTGFGWGGWPASYYLVSEPFWYFYYQLPSHGSSSIEIVTNTAFKDIKVYEMKRIEEFARNTFYPPGYAEQQYGEWLNSIRYEIQASRLIREFATGNDEYKIQIDTTGIKDLSIFIAGNTGGEFASFGSLRLNWTDFREKEVIKQRTFPYQVPVTVEKKRDVTRTIRVPFWEKDR